MNRAKQNHEDDYEEDEEEENKRIYEAVLQKVVMKNNGQQRSQGQGDSSIVEVLLDRMTTPQPIDQHHS